MHKDFDYLKQVIGGPAECSVRTTVEGESLLLEQDDDMIELGRDQLKRLAEIIDEYLSRGDAK